jgi:hypothetical protein
MKGLKSNKNAPNLILKNYKLINNFNQNFLCKNIYKILKIYDFNNKQWNHPLLLNSKNCLFCREKFNYDSNLFNLKNEHLKINNFNELSNFFINNEISFRKIFNLKEKLSKRQFINSSEKYLNKYNYKKDNEKYSDTDLYLNNQKKIKNPRGNKFKSQITLELINKRRTSSVNRKQSTNIENSKSNDNNENKTNDFLKSNRNFLLENGYSNNISFVNENFKRKNKKNNTHTNLFHVFKNKIKEIKDIKMDNNSINKKRNTNNFIYNIFNNFKKYKNEDEKENNINLIKTSYKKSTNNLLSNNNLSFDVGVKSYKEGNKNCTICIGPIQNKFVLNCGDFYCKSCIKGVIMNCMNDISKFDKMICPLCGENIEKNFIIKLLNKEEYEKYTNLYQKIEGLKNKDYIPCPYPDCEDFGKKFDVVKNLLKCGKNHLFCIECNEVLNTNFEQDIKKIKHKCNIQYDININYLLSEKSIRRCPNCNTWVQRDNCGCNNMTCTNVLCNYEFCWICMKKYEPNHYKNPFSTCFGLKISEDTKFQKYKCLRILNCIVIFIGLIFIVFPIIIALFSFILVWTYFVIFILEEPNIKNIKIKSNILKKLFYIIMYLFYGVISIPNLTLGYIIEGIIILAIPILTIINSYRKKKEEERDEDNYI